MRLRREGVAADAGAQIDHDLDVPLTASDSTVERVMPTALEWARRQRGVAFPADFLALRPRPWDVVTMALDRMPSIRRA